MTLQTPDPSAQLEPAGSAMHSMSSIPHRPQVISPTHSIPEEPVLPTHAVPPPTVRSIHGNAEQTDHEHAIDFATHSWDLATDGLKTLTAKREVPIRLERRATGVVPDMLATSRSYMFVLIILACALLMLIGAGIVLFVMLQP